MLNVEDCLVEQVGNVGVVQRVDNLSAAPLADNEAEMSQHPKLMRDRRLLHRDGRRELTDRAGRLPKPTENTDPARCRQRLHRVRHLTRCVCVEGRDRRVCSNPVAHTPDDSMSICS
jgi:hypothetical protein